MNTLEVLKAAKAKVEKGWTQGEMARDANGLCVWSAHLDAVCWCSLGAIKAAAFELGADEYTAYNALRKISGYYIADWNDDHGRTQAEVIEAFSKAIALETARQAS